MALAQQDINFQIRMIVYVHPVHLPHLLVEEERTVVILMRVVHHFRDIMLAQSFVGEVGELPDRDVTDITVGIVLSVHGIGHGLSRRRDAFVWHITEP